MAHEDQNASEISWLLLDSNELCVEYSARSERLTDQA